MYETFLAIAGAMLSTLPYTVVLFFIPGCAPCCSAGCPTICSSVPEEITVTLAGIINGPVCTDCPDYNDTYVVVRQPGGCNYNFTDNRACYYPPAANRVIAHWYPSGANTRIEVDLSIADDLDERKPKWTVVVGASPYDCTTETTYTLAMTQGTLSSYCKADGTDVTATV